jgi:hypothetical protein
MKTIKRTLFSAINGLLVASILCLTACAKDIGADEEEIDIIADEEEIDIDKGFYFDEETFISEWNVWKDKEIDNYSFIMSWEHPTPPIQTRLLPLYEYKTKIIVKNGVMDSFEYIGGAPYNNMDSSIEPQFTSISDMYQKIYDRAQSTKEWWDENLDGPVVFTKYDLKYDEDSHFITFFKPFSKWKSGWIVDTTDHEVKISEFTILDAD